jgi:general secretion pathway protein G
VFNIKKVLKKEGGFTLLELLIVIVIIGILALLIIPNVTSAPKKARDTQRKTDMKAVQKALEEYYTSYNAYPVGTGQADSVLAAALTTGNPPILKTVPTDPKNSAQYVYTYTAAANTSYVLTGCLENGQDQTPGTSAANGTCTTRVFTLNSQN